jgi:hypothetical protein
MKAFSGIKKGQKKTSAVGGDSSLFRPLFDDDHGFSSFFEDGV